MQARWLWRWDLVPFGVLLVTLVMTAVATWYVYENRQQEELHRFQMDAEAMRSSIAARIDTYEAMLLGGAGLFAASETVTRQEFEAYVARLELPSRYAGIQGMGFSQRIRADERDAVLAALQREIPSFAFSPPDQPPGEINAIVYLEPQDQRNQRALGYDMGSEAIRREAMNRARDTASPAASGTVLLVQELVTPGEEQPGFLIYVPVYRDGRIPASDAERRDALEGFVYSPFRAGDLLDGIIGPERRSIAEFEVFDGAPAENRVLYRSASATPRAPRLSVERTLAVAGRQWTLVLHDTRRLAPGVAGALMVLIAAGGTVVSVLLFLMTRAQIVARRDAERTAESLRQSEERLRAANRAKDEFLATISHELRTPLNAIVGWASMLRSRALSAEMQAHALTVIARNAAVQTRLVEDLLDMSRATAGHLALQFQDVDAGAVLRAAVEALQPLAAEGALTLDLEIEGTLGHVEADRDRLEQVVTNLLSNAIKFTPAGGRVVASARRAGDTVVIRVSDTGIGIDASFLPFVFERFRQADSSSTRLHAGVGLGLTIARHLVHLHGGTLDASSAGTNRGATFEVRIPVRQQRRADRHARPHAVDSTRAAS
jgi:signal transduction histidine kinase